MSETKVAVVESLDDEQSMVTLVSKDDEKFVVPANVATVSNLIKTMLDGDPTAKEVPLPNVDGATLKKMLEFMTYHTQKPFVEIEKPIKSANMLEVVSKWDADFIDVDQDTLFAIVVASNWMDVKSLLELSCAKIASMIKNKTPEEIRKTFNIVNDFMPEEEGQIIAENKWAEEA